MTRSIPVHGYPSKTAAIVGMAAEGKTPEEISVLVEQTVGSILGTLAAERAKARRNGNRLSATIYPKAKRIYEQSILVIAEALRVSPADLHRDMSKAFFTFPLTLPNDLLRQDGVQVSSDPNTESVGGADAPPEAPPTPTVSPMSEFASLDEETVTVAPPSAPAKSLAGQQVAELRNLEKPEFTKPEPKVLTSRLKPMAVPTAEQLTGQVHLKNPQTGAYLHWSCELMTMEKAQRWKGTQAQARACKARFALAADLRMVATMPQPITR